MKSYDYRPMSLDVLTRIASGPRVFTRKWAAPSELYEDSPEMEAYLDHVYEFSDLGMPDSDLR